MVVLSRIKQWGLNECVHTYRWRQLIHSFCRTEYLLCLIQNRRSGWGQLSQQLNQVFSFLSIVTSLDRATLRLLSENVRVSYISEYLWPLCLLSLSVFHIIIPRLHGSIQSWHPSLQKCLKESQKRQVLFESSYTPDLLTKTFSLCLAVLFLLWQLPRGEAHWSSLSGGH